MDALLTCEDSNAALRNATPLLWALGHAAIGWMWLNVATAALRISDSAGAPFIAGKLRACRYFLEAKLLKIDAWMDYSVSLTDVAAAMPVEQF